MHTHSEARTHLRSIYTLDSGLAERVAGISWVQKYIDWPEVNALESLAQLIDIAPEAAGLVIGYPWLGDGLAEYEGEALRFMSNIAKRNRALAVELAATPLIAEEPPLADKWAMRNLADIADQDGSLAEQIVELPWVRDGWTETEQWGLGSISHIGVKDGALASQVVRLPWIRDGVTETEQWVLHAIASIHEFDVTLAAQIVGLPWVMDGLTEAELSELLALLDLANENPAALQGLF